MGLGVWGLNLGFEFGIEICVWGFRVGLGFELGLGFEFWVVVWVAAYMV